MAARLIPLAGVPKVSAREARRQLAQDTEHIAVALHAIEGLIASAEQQAAQLDILLTWRRRGFWGRVRWMLFGT